MVGVGGGGRWGYVGAEHPGGLVVNSSSGEPDGAATSPLLQYSQCAIKRLAAHWEPGREKKFK